MDVTHIPEFVYECTPTDRINGQPTETDNTQEMKQSWNRLYIAAVDNENKVLDVAKVTSDIQICGVRVNILDTASPKLSLYNHEDTD